MLLRFDANELGVRPCSPRTTTPKVLVNTMLRYALLFFFSFFSTFNYVIFLFYIVCESIP